MTTMPRLQTPPGACDCHMHFFDSRYPLAAKARRQEPDASVADYRKIQRRLGLDRVVVVQPTAYGRDNRCTLDAMAQMGPSARGIGVIDETITAKELDSMHAAGMRGVRFRMLEPPELPWELLPAMARRIGSLGWHIQFQMDGRDLHLRAADLSALPCPVVIEHIGKFLEPVSVDHPGFQALLKLLDTGRCWVKLSGAYMMSKVGPPLYDDIGALAKALVRHAPERLVWATNWPHPTPGASGTPDEAVLLDLLLDWTPQPSLQHRILCENPARLYGFDAL